VSVEGYTRFHFVCTTTMS